MSGKRKIGSILDVVDSRCYSTKGSLWGRKGSPWYDKSCFERLLRVILGQIRVFWVTKVYLSIIISFQTPFCKPRTILVSHLIFLYISPLVQRLDSRSFKLRKVHNERKSSRQFTLKLKVAYLVPSYFVAQIYYLHLVLISLNRVLFTLERKVTQLPRLVLHSIRKTINQYSPLIAYLCMLSDS